MSEPRAGLASYSIDFGTGSSDVLLPGLPVLGGSAVGNLFPGARFSGTHGSFRLNEAGDLLVGRALIPAGDIEASTETLYSEILSAIRDRKLARCWHYVPDINAENAAGLENYRAFCSGRSIAFERRFGAAFVSMLPAASAVGGASGVLAVVFAASDGEVRHIENPLQVPAYAYPGEYGPRPPSFSRATIVRSGGMRRVFVSGTAAVRGHATIAPNRTEEQLRCTLENLSEISKASGLGPDLARGRAERHFTVYIRHAHDYARTAEALGAALFDPADSVSYLQADICRRDLNLEIEATVTLA